MDILVKENPMTQGIRLYPVSESGLSWLNQGFGWFKDGDEKLYVPFTRDFWDDKPIGLRNILDEAGLTYQFA